MNRVVLFFIFMFMSLSNYAQTWEYKSGSNAFDGKYRVANIIGDSNDFPYNKPGLFVNVFQNKNLNFYISNSGFYNSENDLNIYFAFDNEPEVIYESKEYSLSSDGKTIFFHSFEGTNFENLTNLEFVEKLKKASRLDVRIISNYRKNDIVFSLNGSNAALNSVLTKKYLDNHYVMNKVLAKKVDSVTSVVEIKIQNEKVEDLRIKNMLLNIGVGDEEVEYALLEIKSRLNFYEIPSGKLKNIISKIGIVETLQFKLYDFNDQLMATVAINLPEYKEKLMRSKKAIEKDGDE